jgi:hypothetical protein
MPTRKQLSIAHSALSEWANAILMDALSNKYRDIQLVP